MSDLTLEELAAERKRINKLYKEAKQREKEKREPIREYGELLRKKFLKSKKMNSSHTYFNARLIADMFDYLHEQGLVEFPKMDKQEAQSE